jgi:hypothetical protein
LAQSVADEVQAAFRLGWAVVELRGRYRPDLFRHPEPGAPAGFRRIANDIPLPLGNERKDREVRIEVFEAAAGLSMTLALQPLIGKTPALERIHALVRELENTNEQTRYSRWQRVARGFYAWDAALQDLLVIKSVPAAAYQLGRALAETHWALIPARADNEMGSWLFVLGTQRQETIKRLLARLATYVGPLVVSAVEGSVLAWGEVAHDKQRRDGPDARLKLFQQGLLWRDLIRGEMLPLDLDPLSVGDAWRKVAVYRKAIVALRVPVVFGTTGALLLIGGSALLASGAKYHALTTALSVAGLLGITSAGLYARAKAQLTSLLSELRTAVDEQRVRQAATLVPAVEFRRGGKGF